MPMLPSLMLAVSLLLASPVSAEPLASSSQQEIAKATLVSERAGILPGKPFHLGVLLEPQKGWHTYWENPGDAGMPTSFTWTLPEGFTAGDIDWPAPERVAEGPLITHSYHGAVFLPVMITPPASLDSARSYPLHVKATWLVCKDICIPESAEMEIRLPVADSSPPPTQNASLFARHRAKAVQPLKEKAIYAVSDSHLTLSVPLSAFGSHGVQSAVFFPRQQNMVQYSADQGIAIHNNTLQLTLARATNAPAEGSSGILSVTLGNQQVKHYDITLVAGNVIPPPPAPAAGSALPSGWLASMLFAFLGGIILNLMPCVLPVLSLKTLTVVKKSGESPAMVRKLGVAYTLGILFSFTLIAGALLGLREAGETIGWGYQMQSAAFVGFLVYLLFLVGLNLSGLFDLPVLLGNVGSGINESSTIGTFYTGILASAVATPCTAPFMAAAVGAALTMPTLQAMLVFEALGFGLAFPFLMVSFFPKMLKFLPKPGAWMERFKQFLAFPMYASVIWLVWVLTLQTSAGGTAVVLSGMLAIVMVIWLRHFFAPGSTLYRLSALLALLLIMSASISMLERLEAGQAAVMPAAQDIETVPFSREKLAQLRAAGKPVFVNATAAWCITCQVNASVAINTTRTMSLFRDRGITLMIADWTRRNSDITELLSSHGYNGVPLYIYYPPDHGKPVILPQLLTEDIISGIISNSY